VLILGGKGGYCKHLKRERGRPAVTLGAVDHVLIRRLEHLAGTPSTPRVAYGVEVRDRPGPLYKHGAFEPDRVWVQLHGGLFVARATVLICWLGEYSDIGSVRSRTKGSPLHDIEAFWKGRPRYGYAAVATLRGESWLDEPFWAGPRTYGYEWVVMDDQKKASSWLERKPPPRGGTGLEEAFRDWLRNPSPP
jgi:hypothetical protein